MTKVAYTTISRRGEGARHTGRQTDRHALWVLKKLRVEIALSKDICFSKIYHLLLRHFIGENVFFNLFALIQEQ